MAFAFIAAAHYDNSSSSSGVCNKPTGTAQNDLMLATVKHADAPNSVPSGWTEIGHGEDPASSSNEWMTYWKLAGGGEPADYTWGFAAASRLGITIATFRDGFDTADPIDVTSDTDYTTTDTVNRAASMTVAAANSPLIFIGGTHIGGSGNTQTPPTNPATFTEHVDTWNTGSRFARCIASVIWTGSGATGNIDAAIDASNAAKHAFAVALNPPAAGGGGNPWYYYAQQ